MRGGVTATRRDRGPADFGLHAEVPMRRSPLIVSIIQTLRKASMASSQDSVRRQELLRLLVEPLLAANVSRMR